MTSNATNVGPETASILVRVKATPRPYRRKVGMCYACSPVEITGEPVVGEPGTFADLSGTVVVLNRGRGKPVPGTLVVADANPDERRWEMAY